MKFVLRGKNKIGDIYDFLYTNSQWVQHQENHGEPFQYFVKALDIMIYSICVLHDKKFIYVLH